MTNFPRCCAMYSLSILLAMATFSALLCHIYSFHHATQCLLFPRCCPISSLSTLLCCVFILHAAAALSTFSTRLLRYDPLFHGRQKYVITRNVDIKPFLANYYHIRWASQFPMIGPALISFRSFIILVSKQ